MDSNKNKPAAFPTQKAAGSVGSRVRKYSAPGSAHCSLMNRVCTNRQSKMASEVQIHDSPGDQSHKFRGEGLYILMRFPGLDTHDLADTRIQWTF